MASPFTPAYNDLSFVLASNYAPSSGTMSFTDLSSLPGGVPSSTAPLRLSVQRAKDGVKSIYTFTGKSGNSLTGATVAEGKTDIPLYAGDYAACRVSAGYINDLQSAVKALQSATGEGSSVFDATDYGAAGDGSTDNSTAFAALAAAVNATSSPYPQPVYFPPGVYNYASGLAFNVPVQLYGQSASVLNYTGSGNAITLGPSGLSSGTYHKLYLVRDLTLTGGGSMANGVYVNNFVTMPHFFNVYFYNFGNASAAGIWLAGDNWDAHVSHCEFYSNSSVALNWIWVGQENINSTRLRVQNCLGTCVGTGHGYGIRVNGANNEICNSKIEGFSPAVILGPLACGALIDGVYFEAPNSSALIQYGQEPGNSTNLANYIVDLTISGCYADLHNEDHGYTGALLGPRNTSTGLQGLILRGNQIVGLASSTPLITLNTSNTNQYGSAIDNQGTIGSYSAKYLTGPGNLYNFWGTSAVSHLSAVANDTQGAYVNINAAANVVSGSGGAAAVRFFDAGNLAFQFIATLGNSAGFRYGGFQANTDRDGNKLPLWFFTQDANGALQIALEIGCGQSAGTGGSVTHLGTTSLNSTVYIGDGAAIGLGTTNGTKIGMTSSQKLGFFGATPVVQPAGGSATAGPTYTSTEQAMLQTAYNALRTLGLLG